MLKKIVIIWIVCSIYNNFVLFNLKTKQPIMLIDIMMLNFIAPVGSVTITIVAANQICFKNCE